MHARFLGLSIDTFTLTTIVLLGALPSASNVSLLAERFKADSGRIAQIILLTTTAAFFTFSVAVAIMTWKKGVMLRTGTLKAQSQGFTIQKEEMDVLNWSYKFKSWLDVSENLCQCRACDEWI